MAPLLIALAGMFLLPPSAQASHGRFWSLSWSLDSSDPTQRTIIFHFTYVWATGFYPGDNIVGNVVTTDSIAFGDFQFAPIPTQILSVNAAQGWSYGQGVRLISPGVYAEGILHKYAANGTYLANVNSCCRWGGAQNTTGGFDNYRAETLVNVGTGNNPPVVSLPPIIQVEDNTVATFTIPTVDPDGDKITFRMSTAAENGGIVQPGALSVNPTTGVVTWDITPGTNPAVVAGQYWAAQVMVEDRDTLGILKSKTPIDFLMFVVNTGANGPPVFEAPTPSTVPGPPGIPLSFKVQASDVDAADTLSTLLALNPPIGMTVTPIAPGPSPNPNAKAVQVNWTPPTAGTVIILFQATDAPGGLTTFKAITISGKAPPTGKPEGTFAGANGPIGGNEGCFGFGFGGFVGQGRAITLFPSGTKKNFAHLLGRPALIGMSSMFPRTNKPHPPKA